MKKKYILLALVAICVIACAAAMGYMHFHTEEIPPELSFVSPEKEEKGKKDSEDIPNDVQKRVQEIMQDMTTDEKIYQLMFVRPETLTNVQCAVRAGDSTQKAIEQMPIGGIIYFSQNFQDENQTKQMLSKTQEFARTVGAEIPLFMGVDEEGGMVARLATKLGTTKFDDMEVYGKDNDSKQAYEIGQTLAKDISSFGFNMDFAPVADVLSNDNNTEIGARSFGSDPKVVANMVENEVKGLQEHGVMATLKHFPGHGSTESNSHKGTSESDRTLEQLQECDFVPFKAGIKQNAAFILVSHMTATEIDDVPCTLSSKIVTDLLRKELGYQGIIITDGMDMGAITENYSNGEATVKAMQAGVDMILCPPSISDAYDALKKAIANGELTEQRIDESVARILTAKLNYGLIQ